MRAGVPECLKCAHSVQWIRDSAIQVENNRSLDPYNQNGPSPKNRFSPSPTRLRGTKTRLKMHTGCCRVRRNRKRLTSNGSIETDAANRRGPYP
jgi:hypothetical protein